MKDLTFSQKVENLSRNWKLVLIGLSILMGVGFFLTLAWIADNDGEFDIKQDVTENIDSYDLRNEYYDKLYQARHSYNFEMAASILDDNYNGTDLKEAESELKYIESSRENYLRTTFTLTTTVDRISWREFGTLDELEVIKCIHYKKAITIRDSLIANKHLLEALNRQSCN